MKSNDTNQQKITLLLVDYEKINTDCFFDYRVDKLCSITASMATMAFNNIFSKYVKEFDLELAYNDNGIDTEENRKLWKRIQSITENNVRKLRI